MKNIKTKLFQFTLILIAGTVLYFGVTEVFNRAENISLLNKAKAVSFFDTSYTISEVNIIRTKGIDNRTPMQKFYDAFENDKHFQEYIVNMNVRRNNPGNLRCASQPHSGCEGGFAVFPSPLVGFRALLMQISLDSSRGDTLKTFIEDYAPRHDNNDTEAYIAFIENKLGNRNNLIKDLDVLQLAVLVVEFEHSLRY